MNQNFKHIVSLLRKLPGVGPRQADTELEELGTAITNLRTNISFCNICFNISDNHICGVCSDKKRDRTKIMVLEKVTDLESIEKTGLYRGLYHILGGAINPIDGVLPENLRLRELDTRISNTTKDLPNTAGETTAMYVRDMLDKKDNVRITHLARGLASGSHLEYIDEITLKNALEFRK
ncbi:MAG: Recombination protein RecR [Candidatus Yanofskybacteria bacterium GW2011_GWF2_43_596]|nr:MAG: Recombination protein RecR [Candidatus Yanofskybacteria bacterium GW2011_GWF2_43_596]